MSGAKDETRSKHALYMQEYRSKDHEGYKAAMQAYHRKRRIQVISHYGGKCVCCGEDSFDFLALDHIKGGGEKHRNKVGGGSHMIAWIIKNDFPPIFRVLCHNCNMAIGFYGRCPHEEQRVLYLVS